MAGAGAIAAGAGELIAAPYPLEPMAQLFRDLRSAPGGAPYAVWRRR